MDSFKSFIIKWNNKFPLDRWYREKYKLPFNSIEHCESNPIDIYFEYLEEVVWKEHEKSIIDRYVKEERYKKDGWLSEAEIKEEDEDELFNKIDLSKFNT